MPSFLTNSKMSPELAARIEASVSGRTPVRRRSGARPLRTAVLRLTAVVTLMTGVGGVAWAWERSVAERERARTALLDAIAREAKGITEGDLETPTRAETVMLRTHGAHGGDLVPAALRAPSALATLLSEPALYMRGPLEAFRSKSSLDGAAPDSAKDTFLSCLLDPPASNEERVLFARVQAVRTRDRATEERMHRVHRFGDALVGLPLLGPAWGERVRETDRLLDIAELHRIFQKAPLREARAAARAKVLIVVQDEPKEPGTVTELDGATVHDVRVGIYDVRSGETRLRVMRRADPGWVSERRRPHDARELEDCRVAWGIRQEVKLD